MARRQNSRSAGVEDLNDDAPPGFPEGASGLSYPASVAGAEFAAEAFAHE